MRYANWLVATAIGASLTLSSASGWAQLKTSAKEDVDAPKGKALGVKGDLDVPKGKALGVKGTLDVPKAKNSAAVRGTASGAPATVVPDDTERREVRRIPTIDANAGATFRSTQLIGTNITDADGRLVGKVVDFVSDARGNILYSIISYSGSAGFTGKLFAIPPSGLNFTAGENNTTTAQFAFDPQLLKNAPSFSSTRFPDFGDQAFLNELKAFYANLLPSTANPRANATDPTVPANGPGDRVQTQDQANTPTRPVDPTLPANGPGDRAATANPVLPRTGTQPGTTTPDTRIPGTTGTENAGFPATSGTTTRAGTSGAAGTGTDLSAPITSSRTSAATRSDSSIVGRTGSPAGSGVPGGTVVGRTGSPASESVRESVAAEAEGTTANNRMMLRSSQMLGMSIQDNKGQLIGKVTDFVGDPTGNRQFAIVSLTGDDRMIILPMHALHFQTGARGSNFATLRVAPGQLKKAPSFTGDDWPDFTNQAFMSNLQKFWEPLLPVEPTNVGVTTPGGSRSTPGGTRAPDWPSRPIPPGGPVPRPGPDGQFPRTTPSPDTRTIPSPDGRTGPTTGSTTPTGPTTPGGSRSTPGGTRTPDFPSRPIPPGGPVPSNPAPPRTGAPRLPAPGTPVPGVPGIPALPGGAAPGAGSGSPAPSGGGASGGSGTGASGS